MIFDIKTIKIMEENIKKSRRKFVKDIAKVTAITSISLVPTTQLIAQNENNQSEVIESQLTFLTLPYLQNLSPDSVDIMFITNNKAYSWVEFGDTETNKLVHTLEDGFVKAYNRVNCIQLTHLKPNTEYKYKIFSKQIVQFEPYELAYGTKISSDEFSFKTPEIDEKEISCIIFNDIHDRPNSFGELMIVNENKPFDFAMLNGDMFDFEEDEAQVVRDLLAPCANLFAKNKPISC